jgi:hypothetical protein
MNLYNYHCIKNMDNKLIFCKTESFLVVIIIGFKRLPNLLLNAGLELAISYFLSQSSLSCF